jgi:hypothetical protein
MFISRTKDTILCISLYFSVENLFREYTFSSDLLFVSQVFWKLFSSPEDVSSKNLHTMISNVSIVGAVVYSNRFITESLFSKSLNIVSTVLFASEDA